MSPPKRFHIKDDTPVTPHSALCV